MSASTTYTFDDIKKKSRSVFAKHDFVDKVYVFGSYARGEENADSDVDFYIQRSRETLLDFYSLYDELQEALNTNVDIVHDGEQIAPYLMRNIQKDKVLIYER